MARILTDLFYDIDGGEKQENVYIKHMKNFMHSVFIVILI